jgi:hypothetical protein
MTWFNPQPWRFQDPSTGRVWHDVQAQQRGEGPHASGAPITTPGIALPSRQTLGGWYEVTLPDGRKVVTQQTDIGPMRKGGIVDFNAALASQLYPGGPQAFPSGGARASTRFLGKSLPEGVSPGLQRERRAAAGAAEEDGGGGPSGSTGMSQWRAWRREMEKPIRMHIEAPEAPSRFTPRLRRASADAVQNRELHRERERAYVDMEE